MKLSSTLRRLWIKSRLTLRYQVGWRLFPKKEKEPNTAEIIVSLTSYPPRFKTLHLTLWSLLDQSVRPKIVLWVANTDRHNIPKRVAKLSNQGIEIRFCDDILSYKKVIPSISSFPDKCIVTADDDVYYPSRWFETFLDWHEREPSSILCMRAHEARLHPDETLRPYTDWHQEVSTVGEDGLLFPTGVGGVLYPPRSLSTLATDAELFMNLCPRADDVWLFWMAKINGTRHVKIPGAFSQIMWRGSQHAALAAINVEAGGNDKAIAIMERRFGTIPQIVRKSQNLRG